MSFFQSGFRQFLLFLLFALPFSSAKSQDIAVDDSCGLSISLLTCSPGEELYSIFGHCAIRVRDERTGMDIIFNYGTFDFNDPDFYTKFIRGKLLYFVSVDRFDQFRYEYSLEGRSIREQLLNISCDEKRRLFENLKVNMQEENRFYKYDFLFDNCATRLRDIVGRSLNGHMVFHRIIPSEAPTFRDLIHDYLKAGGEYWSQLGIDMLLGSRIDRPVKNEEAMFLPDYLEKGFDSAFIQNRSLVSEKSMLLHASGSSAEPKPWFRPFVCTLLVLLLIGALQFSRSLRVKKMMRLFDYLFFFLLGILGCLMLFMWFGTDHAACSNNYNLLWALPTHIVAVFFLNSKRTWVRRYFMVMSAWYFLLFFLWSVLPQDMNIAIIPVVVLAFMRCVVHFRKNRSNEENKKTKGGI